MSGSTKKKFGSWRVSISYVDHKRRSCKGAEPLYHMWIQKGEVKKLRSLYVMSGSLKKKL